MVHAVRVGRRQFLRTATAISAPLLLSSKVWAQSPNGRLQHACIGVDGMGWADLSSLSTHPQIEIVALCDVDTDRMQKAREKFPQARCYQDWRELLEKEADQIDSVNVSVPDHMHAPISMSAVQRGKHVYCQKPLTHEVAEARALRLAAEKAKVATQMGNQIQSESVYRTAVQMIRQGMIGKVHAVHAWAGARFPQRGRPAGADAVPASLNWDHWLGVAPVRPFKQGVYHPFHWRGWQDFGGGALGDFGCHILDTPFKALELTAPRSLRAEVPEDWAQTSAWNTENWPDWEIVHYEFPATAWTVGSSLPVTWYDGGKQPARELFEVPGTKIAADFAIPGSGALFIGEEGHLLLPHVGEPHLLPGSRHLGAPIPTVAGGNHYHAFVDAALGKGTTGSNFSFAGPLAEATLLGTIAVRLPGQSIEWHHETLSTPNSADAQKLVGRAYRDGWKINGLSPA